MEYTAIVHKDADGGYWAEVPELLGLVTEGDTLDEIVVALNEAVQGWLEADAKRGGQPKPPATPPRVRTLELAA